MVDHGFGAFLVGLDREPKTVPAFERSVAERGCDHLERQFQPIRFLGIDGEIQIVGLGAAREIDQPRHQFRHHAPMAYRLETRMQRGEFDGDAGPIGQRAIVGGAADRFDRAAVGIEIALRVGGGARAFAEHVEGIARRAGRMRPRQCSFDGLAEHEMAAHQPHRLPCGGAHRRNAQPFCQSPDRSLRGFAGLNHACRHAQRPGRRIDQEGAGFGLVAHEVALAELVLDELVGGAAIRYPQQGFREHHQRQALLGGERKLAKHVLDAAEPVVTCANGADQPRRGAIDPRVLLRTQAGDPEQPGRNETIVGRVGRLERRKRCGIGRHGRLLNGLSAIGCKTGSAFAVAPGFPRASIMQPVLASLNRCDSFRSDFFGLQRGDG